MEFFLFFLLAFCFFFCTEAAIFTFENKCSDTIWPGILPEAGKPQLMNGGFVLKPGENVTINVPTEWSGRFWGRRGCSFDVSGNGTCETGDCDGVLGCAAGWWTSPVTQAEFILDSPLDFYDVSLVGGYNVPISISPSGGSGTCRTVKCVSDLNRHCPRGLEVKKNGRVVACKSACSAFNTQEYCCLGEFGNAETCKPNVYSKAFKSACPLAYSYAFDDATSLFTCQKANYLISFC